MNRINSKVSLIIEKINNSADRLVFLSTYFTSKSDPLRNLIQKNNNFEYFRNWYESICELNLYGVIFSDNVSDDFIQQYQTDKIYFVRCKLGPHSLNDERFFIFHEFVQYLNDDCFIVSTDINDVVINKNPIGFFYSNPEKLFVGRGIRKTWKDGIWALNALKHFNQKLPFSLEFSFLIYPMLTPGTIGGKKQKVQKVFKQMIDLFSICGDDGNYDMQVFNYVMKKFYYPMDSRLDTIIPFSVGYWYYYLKYRISRKFERRYNRQKYDVTSYEESVCSNKLIYAGFPFVSIVGNYERKGESEAFLLHK